MSTTGSEFIEDDSSVEQNNNTTNPPLEDGVWEGNWQVENNMNPEDDLLSEEDEKTPEAQGSYNHPTGQSAEEFAEEPCNRPHSRHGERSLEDMCSRPPSRHGVRSPQETYDRPPSRRGDREDEHYDSLIQETEQTGLQLTRRGSVSSKFSDSSSEEDDDRNDTSLHASDNSECTSEQYALIHKIWMNRLANANDEYPVTLPKRPNRFTSWEQFVPKKKTKLGERIGKPYLSTPDLVIKIRSEHDQASEEGLLLPRPDGHIRRYSLDYLKATREKLNDHNISARQSRSDIELPDPVYTDHENWGHLLRVTRDEAAKSRRSYEELRQEFEALEQDAREAADNEEALVEKYNLLHDDFMEQQGQLMRERSLVSELKNQQTFSLALSSFRDGEQWPAEQRRAVAEIIVSHIAQENKKNPPLNTEQIMVLLEANYDIVQIAAWIEKHENGYSFKAPLLFKEILFSGEAFNLGLVNAYLTIPGKVDDDREPADLQDYLDTFEELREEWNKNFRTIHRRLQDAEDKCQTLSTDLEDAQAECANNVRQDTIMLREGSTQPQAADLDDMRELVQQLQQSNDVLQSEAAEATRLREEAQQRERAIAELQDVANANLISKDEEIERIQIRLDGTMKTLETMEGHFDNEVEFLERKAAAKSKQADRYRRQSMDTESQFALFRDQHHDCSEVIARLQVRVSELEASLTAQTAKVIHLENDSDSLQSKLGNGEAQSSHIASEASDFVIQLQEEIDALRLQNSDCENVKNILKSSQDENQALHEQLSRQATVHRTADELKKQVKSLKFENQTLQAQVKNMQSNRSGNAYLQEGVSAMKMTLDETNRKLERSKAETAETKAKLEETKQELERSKADTNTAEENFIENYKQTLRMKAVHDSELAEARKRIQQVERQNKRLSALSVTGVQRALNSAPARPTTGLTGGYLSIPHHTGARPLERGDALQRKLAAFEAQMKAESDALIRGEREDDIVNHYLDRKYTVKPMARDENGGSISLWTHVLDDITNLA